MRKIWTDILTSGALLLGARILSKIATIAVMVAAAHKLGTESFGVFSAVIVLTQLSGLVADFGLIMPTIRQVSRNRDTVRGIVESSLPARLFWSSISLAILIVAGAAMRFPLHVIVLFSVSAILEIGAMGFVRSFEGLGEIRVVTIYTLIERLSFSAWVLIALSLAGTVSGVAVAYFVSNSSMFVFAFILFRRRFGTPGVSFSLQSVRELSLIGFPFFLTAIFSALYYRVDTLLLSMLRTDSEVGIYNAALRIIDAQMFIPLALMIPIYPVLSRMHDSKDPDFVGILQRSMFLFAFLGALATAVIFFAAPLVMGVLYPPAYATGTPALQILSLMLLFYFVNFLLSQSLIATGQEVKFTSVMVGAALISIIANAAIIPTFGYVGASWIRVIIECSITIVFLVILVSYLRKNGAGTGATISKAEVAMMQMDEQRIPLGNDIR